MNSIHPNEQAIMAEGIPDDEGESINVRVIVDLRVTNKTLLRRIAADRMSRSGFEPDSKEHEQAALHELAYQAMIGSNPDPLSPTDMGFEIVQVSGG